MTRIWAENGTRPRAIRQQQFEYSYLFGAACPASGQAVGLVLSTVNTAAMKLHINAIADSVPKGRHAVVIADSADWHSLAPNTDKVALLKLPLYSPELNPIEQVWAWLKQKWLSSRAYEDYEAIVDACCEVWNLFANDEALVKQLCDREWVKHIHT